MDRIEYIDMIVRKPDILSAARKNPKWAIVLAESVLEEAEYNDLADIVRRRRRETLEIDARQRDHMNQNS